MKVVEQNAEGYDPVAGVSPLDGSARARGSTPSQVRQRRGVKADDTLPPAPEKVSFRRFWLLTGCGCCCTFWCVAAFIAVFLFLSIPPEVSVLQYYHMVSDQIESIDWAKEELDAVPRRPWPAASDPVFNTIEELSDDYYRMYQQPSGNLTGCEHLKGPQREFCLVSIGDRAVKNWDKYEALREKCEWKVEDAFEKYPNFLYSNFSEIPRDSGYTHFSYEHTQELLNEHRNRKPPNRMLVKTCEVQEDKDWHWKTIRIGPFFSTGGYDWHRYLIPNTTVKGHRLFSGFFYGPVDRNGKVLDYPPIHIHHMHSATSQCNMISRIWSGGTPDPIFADMKSTQWYFDIHGDRQCKKEHGGMACLHKELPKGFAQYVYLPQCIFGEVNDVRPKNSPVLEFWLEHAYRITKNHAIARPTGFFASGPGTHVHIEEGVNPATAVMGALKSYRPQLYPVDDYDTPSNVDSVMWCSFKIPFDLEFLQVWIHTHHQFTYDMLMFRSHPRALGLDTGPIVLENHYTPIQLPDTGIDRHQLKKYMYNNMRRNGGSVACKIGENRFEKGTPGVLPKGVPNDIYDRFTIPNCSDNLFFHEDEIVTVVAIHGPVTGKVLKKNHSVMHSGWNGEFVRPECKKLKKCINYFVDDLHLSCLESASSSRAVAIALAQSGLQNTRDNIVKIKERLAAYAVQGGGLT